MRGAGMLFGRLVSTSCGHLRSLQDVSGEPDICDDTFLLAGRGLSYCPAIVLTPRVLPTLLDSALAGILVQHRRAPHPATLSSVRLWGPPHCRLTQAVCQGSSKGLLPASFCSNRDIPPAHAIYSVNRE